MQKNPYLKDKNDKVDARENLPTRLNLLLGIVLVLMMALVIQLAILTIAKGADFQAEVNYSDERTEKGNMPRGLIYDANNQVLVGNQAHQAITYTRGYNTTSSEIYATANKLSKYLTVDTSRLTARSYVDYYLANDANNTKIYNIIIKDKPKDINWTADDTNAKEVAYVQKQIDAGKITFSAADKNAIMIFQRMTGASQLSTTFIKEDGVTDKELATIGERFATLPGVKIGTSWTRQYPQGDSFKQLVGSVTTEAAGLPEDSVNSLLAQGYSRNESVGVSSLEKNYESVLRGSASQSVVNVNSESNTTSQATQTYAGQAGDNLNLTINAKYQEAVEKILHDNLPGGNVEGAYATVINPYTGGIYAMAGYDRDYATGEVTADPLGNVNHAIIMGSAVKPAILAKAFQTNTITPANTTLLDQTVALQGSKDIKSYWNQSGTPTPITAQTALEVSSNTYFVQLAMKMGGQNYQAGDTLHTRSDTFSLLRNGLAQFGLGYKTGIDVGGESAGFKGPTTGENQGKQLFEAFGNYDSYTVLQMARYVSAIANGGYVIQPHLVNTITRSSSDGKTQATVWKATPNIQSQVSLTKDQWGVIKQGMWQVANGSNAWNTGGSNLHNLVPHVAAKTGTAETTTNGQDTYTESIVLYVPGQPVAMAMAIPGMDNFLDGTNTKIAAAIVNAYWKYVQNKPAQ